MQVSTEYKALVLPTKEKVASSATVWDPRQHLLVEVSLPDIVLPLHLDPLLPVVLEAVERAADRRARVAAAEVLHAVLLVMVGRTSQQTEDYERRAPMTELFRRVLPVVLRLCSDTDSVIQGLFQPLFSQLIHWFTKDRKHASLETECLLKCLMDTICDNKDAARYYFHSLFSDISAKSRYVFSYSFPEISG